MGYGRPLLGTILGEKFNLPETKLEEALAQQREKGGRLGDVLVRLRAVRDDEVLQALAHQFEYRGFLTWNPTRSIRLS